MTCRFGSGLFVIPNLFRDLFLSAIREKPFTIHMRGLLRVSKLNWHALKSPLAPLCQRGVLSLPLEREVRRDFIKQCRYHYETVNNNH